MAMTGWLGCATRGGGEGMGGVSGGAGSSTTPVHPCVSHEEPRMELSVCTDSCVRCSRRGTSSWGVHPRSANI
jgi:hypothetical protein